MNALIPIIEQLLVNGALRKKSSLVKSSKYGLALIAISGLLAFIAIFFLALSGYGWLLMNYEQPLAALISAASTLAVAGVAGMSGYFIILRKKRQISARKNDLVQNALDIGEAFGEELSQSTQENPKTAVALASIAGFIAAESLH